MICLQIKLTMGGEAGWRQQVTVVEPMGPRQDEEKGDKKIRASMWWTVTGVSWTKQEAGMTGPQWVRVRRVRPEAYWLLP